MLIIWPWYGRLLQFMIKQYTCTNNCFIPVLKYMYRNSGFEMKIQFNEGCCFYVVATWSSNIFLKATCMSNWLNAVISCYVWQLHLKAKWSCSTVLNFSNLHWTDSWIAKWENYISHAMTYHILYKIFEDQLTNWKHLIF